MRKKKILHKLGFHDWTSWSKPYDEEWNIKYTLFYGEFKNPVSVTRTKQKRECLICKKVEEREL